jgi:uncharacterized protein
VTRNPFHYGSPVSGDSFCDRRREADALTRAMLDGQNVIVLSPRRYGKTSLLLHAITTVRRRRGRTGYASLIRASNRREVAETLLGAVLAGPASWLARRRDQLGTLLEGVRVQPAITVHPSGVWQVSFSTATAAAPWEAVLEDSLRILVSVSRHHPTSLVIDEFQRAAEIDDGLPGVFKAVADELRDVSLVFAGSKLHLMRDLSSGPGAPLLGMGERVALDVVPEDEMVAFLCKRASAGGKSMSVSVAADVYARADAVPNDVQKLAYAAFAAAGPHVDAAAVHGGFEQIIALEGLDYAELLESCSPSQQRLLKALAVHPESHVYSHDFLHKVDVGNANAIRKALDALSKREVVRKASNGQWRVASPFFRAWLATT